MRISNDWGNLGRHVAWRHQPERTGIIVSDFGPFVCVAEAEDGEQTHMHLEELVGVGSPSYVKALAKWRAG